ncbi:hypothetical protein GCM10020000_14190 [Streptomyces olivoverticillatus]
MNELKVRGKPFDISKREVWESWCEVKGNKGAPSVDGQSIADFEADLQSNLYKIWNRMSSGTYFPPPVRAVEIPKQHGGGMRMLGIPTVADRVAQALVARHLGIRVDPVFHPDSCACRQPLSPYATWAYSWMRPPRRSRRMTRDWSLAEGGSGVPTLSGGVVRVIGEADVRCGGWRTR